MRFSTATCASSTTSLGVGGIDALVECSAEPSVLAGVDGSPDYVRAGEPRRRLQLPRAGPALRRAARVPLDQPRLSGRRARAPRLPRAARRGFELDRRAAVLGASRTRGSPRRSRSRARARSTARRSSAAELLIEEYAAAYGLRAVIDRCGVIAGPWQMGKVDQGVFTYWMLAHHFGRPLTLHRLRRARASRSATCCTSRTCSTWSTSSSRDPSAGPVRPSTWAGAGTCSLSLHETTELCRRDHREDRGDPPARRGAPRRHPDLHLRLRPPVRA